MVNLGVVILNWNGYKDTIECLESIKSAVYEDFKLKVVVVDNASTDDSFGIISNFQFPISNFQFEVIRNGENMGFAGGNNVGIKIMQKEKVDYTLILNNDTLVDRNFFKELLSYAKKNTKFGILSPKIYFAKGYEYHKKRYKRQDLGKVIWAAGGEMDWENVFGKNQGVDVVDKGQYERIKEVDFSTGAAMLLSRKLIEKVGLFDDRYFMYFEDADLITRALKSGFKNYYVPKAVVWHKVARSSGIGSDLNDYFITRNRLLFGTMFAPLRSKLALYKESLRFIFNGRDWQKIGVRDFYLGKFGKGSWEN
ncbi:glycosyltransferase family 2 protein [Candidatus Woesebacteria bacterium]|nr:glycosyltransferase family 2 protein [Candidatus Woesebacteria bacterium]